jgi:hypothetical protein
MAQYKGLGVSATDLVALGVVGGAIYYLFFYKPAKDTIAGDITSAGQGIIGGITDALGKANTYAYNFWTGRPQPNPTATQTELDALKKNDYLNKNQISVISNQSPAGLKNAEDVARNKAFGGTWKDVPDQLGKIYWSSDTLTNPVPVVTPTYETSGAPYKSYVQIQEEQGVPFSVLAGGITFPAKLISATPNLSASTTSKTTQQPAVQNSQTHYVSALNVTVDNATGKIIRKGR